MYEILEYGNRYAKFQNAAIDARDFQSAAIIARDFWEVPCGGRRNPDGRAEPICLVIMAGKKITLSHNLMGCRLDNWVRLLRENPVSKEHRAQACFMTLVSAILAIPAFIEWLIFRGPIKRTKLKKDPVYIVGHWRTGTTYLQNLMTRDPQFAWFDPLKTITFNNCILLKPILKKIIAKFIKGTRAMDNLEYEMNLPMEEVFAQATISTQAIAHMLVFPDGGRGAKFINTAFTDEQPEKEQREWLRAYDYVLKKATYIEHGKQLLLKSPENTCRIGLLKKRYKGAKFINMYRNPYRVIMSTINMFNKEMSLFCLNDKPTEGFIEDTVIDLFERVYRKAFKELYSLPESEYIDICYEDFCDDPEGNLKKIYKHLGLKGYKKALPYFKKYIKEQENYQKNEFVLRDDLREKINGRMGFYFERYGYEMI